MIAAGALEEVRQLVPVSNVIEIEIENPGVDGWLGGLRAVGGVDSVEMEGAQLRVSVHDLAQQSPEVLGWLRDHGYRYSHLATQRADLETVFLTLTGRSVRNQ